MKRIEKTGLTLLVILLFPAILSAQEKKDEQRVKIVVVDKSGTKVEIDTLIKDSGSIDSIMLKNGEVIYMTNHVNMGTVKNVESRNGKIIMTFTSDEKGNKEVTKELTVISGDSATVLKGGEGSTVVVMKDGNHIIEGTGGKVVTWSSSSGSSDGAKYIYINEGNGSHNSSEKTIEVKVTTDEKEKNVEMTKYVIAKDGMVVSIEGNDEAKVKDLVKDIESRMGVNRGDKDVTQETKKTTIK
jgi:hypothetical protein